MKKLLIGIFFLIVFWGVKAQNLEVKGIVVDKASQTPLENVSIFVKLVKTGTYTQPDGRFRLSLPEGKYKVILSLIGYKTEEKIIHVSVSRKDYSFEMNQDISSLDEVNITAHSLHKATSVSKINVNERNIPITTSKVGRELLEQLQVSNINDALKYTAGIKPTVNYGGFQTFKMRGFGAPVIMLDGARDERMNLSNSAPITSLASVERIEYLKGPASVLYGHSAVGGILNIVRKQPTQELNADFSASLGSFGKKETAVGVGNSIAKGLNYRFDASLGESEGWRDYGIKTANAYLALDFQIDKKNKVELKVGANDDLYDTETGLPAVSADIYDATGKIIYKKGDLPKSFDRKQRYNDPVDFLKHENINTAFKYIHQLTEDSNLSFHASYSDDLIDYFSTEELSYSTDDKIDYGTYFMSKGKKKFIDLEHLNRSFPFRFSHETKSYQHYLEYVNKFETGKLQHNFLVGYYFMYLDRTTFSGYEKGDVSGAGLHAKISIVNPILNQGNLSTKFSKAKMYKESIHSVYFQNLVDISPKVKAMLGGRFDYYDMDYQMGYVKTARNIYKKDDKSSIVNKTLSYRFGLVYKPIESLSLYSSMSNYFRPSRSTYNEQYIYVNKDGNEFFPTDGKEVFKPESGYQFEAGLKYNYGAFLDVSVATYYIKKENIKEYLGESSGGKKIYGQVGVVESKGVELEVTARPVKSLSIIAGYTFCDATYKEFSSNKYIKTTKEGNLLRRNPKNQFYLWSFYKVPSGFLQNLSLGFGVNYTGDMYTGSSNEYVLPKYWLTEASIGYSFAHVYMKFKVNNLLDEKYYSNSVMSHQYIPGATRNFLFTVGYKL